MKSLFTSLLLATLSITSLPAQQKPTALNKQDIDLASPKYILLQIEYIEVDHQTLTSMFEGNGILKSATTHRSNLQKLILEDKAKLVESSIITSSPGQAARVATTKEVTYPTEFDPAEVPEAGENGKISKGAVALGPTPTAFEERPVGIIVEAEPVILPLTNDQCVQVDLAPEIVSYEGQTTWATWKDKFGNANVTMPKFYKLSLNATATLKHNKYRLLGVLSPKDDKEGFTNPQKKVIVFARALIKCAGE